MEYLRAALGASVSPPPPIVSPVLARFISLAAAGALLLASGEALAWAAPALGPEIKVNVSTVNHQFTPRVAVFPDGGFVVAWAAEPKGLPPQATPTVVVHARFFAAGGAPLGGEFLLARPADLVSLDAVVAPSNDRFALVWDGYENPSGVVLQIWTQMFRRNGSPLTRAAMANLPSPFHRYFGVAGPTPGGGVAIGWVADMARTTSVDYYTNSVARVFSPQLAPLSGELTLGTGSPLDNSGPVPDSIAVAPDGSLAASLTYVGDEVWVYAVRLAPDGAPLHTDDIDVHTAGGNDSSLAMTPDGRFALVWDTEGPENAGLLPLPPQPAAPILGQVIDAEGGARSAAAFQVNRRGPGQRVTPQIVWLPTADGGSGGFLTLWQDESGQDGQGGGVFGHLLDASGTPFGGDFLVNATTAGNQVGPQLAGGPHGAVAMWQDGATTDIYARQVTVP